MAILAGGEGLRMRPLVRAWLGEDRPKQFCNLVGCGSMLQQTIDLALELVDERHIVTVIGPGQRRWLGDAGERTRGVVIEQPLDRGTLAAALTAAAYISNVDPEATMVLTPSDVIARPEDHFAATMGAACFHAEIDRRQMVLLGVRPDQPRTEYGWIEPAAKSVRLRTHTLGDGVSRVHSLHEKPCSAAALELLRSGALWNTMVLATTTATFLSAVEQCVAPMSLQVTELCQAMREFVCNWVVGEASPKRLTQAYERAPSLDFTDAFLTAAASRCSVLPVRSVYWQDLGTPERLSEYIAARGGDCRVPAELLPRTLSPGDRKGSVHAA